MTPASTWWGPVWALSWSGEMQGTHCLGFQCGPALDPLWVLPQGHGPDMAGAGGEVIRGVFHADRMRAGPQREGRKL